MSANINGPQNELMETASICGPGFSNETISEPNASPVRLADLPIGARLVLRCRKDWRDATVVAIADEKITLRVSAPSGHTYRARHPPDAMLFLDGSIPVLGKGQWRIGRVRYDIRW